MPGAREYFPCATEAVLNRCALYRKIGVEIWRERGGCCHIQPFTEREIPQTYGDPGHPWRRGPSHTVPREVTAFHDRDRSYAKERRRSGTRNFEGDLRGLFPRHIWRNTTTIVYQVIPYSEVARVELY